jgi:hypothetical protein
MLGCIPRRSATAPVPTIAKNRATANEIKVPMNVTSKTRTGIAYHLGARVGGFGDILLTYTIQCDRIEGARGKK